jgi:hypothetical protein
MLISGQLHRSAQVCGYDNFLQLRLSLWELIAELWRDPCRYDWVTLERATRGFRMPWAARPLREAREYIHAIQRFEAEEWYETLWD